MPNFQPERRSLSGLDPKQLIGWADLSWAGAWMSGAVGTAPLTRTPMRKSFFSLLIRPIIETVKEVGVGLTSSENVTAVYHSVIKRDI